MTGVLYYYVPRCPSAPIQTFLVLTVYAHTTHMSQPTYPVATNCGRELVSGKPVATSVPDDAPVQELVSSVSFPVSALGTWTNVHELNSHSKTVRVSELIRCFHFPDHFNFRDIRRVIIFILFSQCLISFFTNRWKICCAQLFILS